MRTIDHSGVLRDGSRTPPGLQGPAARSAFAALCPAPRLAEGQHAGVQAEPAGGRRESAPAARDREGIKTASKTAPYLTSKSRIEMEEGGVCRAGEPQMVLEIRPFYGEIRPGGRLSAAVD